MSTTSERDLLSSTIANATTDHLMDTIVSLALSPVRAEADRLVLALTGDELCKRLPRLESAASAWAEDLDSPYATVADLLAAHIRKIR